LNTRKRKPLNADGGVDSVQDSESEPPHRGVSSSNHNTTERRHPEFTNRQLAVLAEALSLLFVQRPSTPVAKCKRRGLTRYWREFRAASMSAAVDHRRSAGGRLRRPRLYRAS